MRSNAGIKGMYININIITGMYLFVEFSVRLVIAAVQNSDTLLCTQLLQLLVIFLQIGLLTSGHKSKGQHQSKCVAETHTHTHTGREKKEVNTKLTHLCCSGFCFKWAFGTVVHRTPFMTVGESSNLRPCMPV